MTGSFPATSSTPRFAVITTTEAPEPESVTDFVRGLVADRAMVAYAVAVVGWTPEGHARIGVELATAARDAPILPSLVALIGAAVEGPIIGPDGRPAELGVPVDRRDLSEGFVCELRDYLAPPHAFVAMLVDKFVPTVALERMGQIHGNHLIYGIVPEQLPPLPQGEPT